MRNYLVILIVLFITSCQVLDEREIMLSNTFCKSCRKPLKDILLKSEGVFVVKYNDDNSMFYNYDKSLIDVDSLENVLEHKGFLPRKDSIVIHPVCCNRKAKEVIKIDTIN